MMKCNVESSQKAAIKLLHQPNSAVAPIPAATHQRLRERILDRGESELLIQSPAFCGLQELF